MEQSKCIYPQPEKFLKNTLIANAAFSTISALAILIFATQISEILFERTFEFYGFGPSEVLFESAIGILVFATLVFLTAKKKTINQNIICFIMTLDIAWVLCSVVLLALFSEYLSTVGFWVIVVIAGIVADFAIFQGIGIARINRAWDDTRSRSRKHA